MIIEIKISRSIYSIGSIFLVGCVSFGARGVQTVSLATCFLSFENEIEAVDRLVTNTCRFEDGQLADLVAGQTLIYKANTASKQPLYDLTLVKK